MYFDVYMNIYFNNRASRIFIQRGFFPDDNSLCRAPYHKHSYAEIHMISEGSSVINVENREYTLNRGDVILIPAKAYHTIKTISENARHSAFQIDYNCGFDIITKNIPPEILNIYFNEITECRSLDSDFSKVVPYLELILSTLLNTRAIYVHETTDYSHLIHEFLSISYNNDDVKVSQLANTLHLSEKQTQLLVKRHTGKTFKQALASYRMKIADYLISNTNMSMTDIASAVGFKTYSGFWKMYKTHKEEMKNSH